MLLSIIIPAYNVTKYIADCLDSCLAQVSASASDDRYLRQDEVEIIVVDDGSTDETPILLHTYAEANPCIKVLRQENQGQSVARNLAIAHAQGEYIYMVDSDDRMVLPDAGQPTVLPMPSIRSLRYDIIGLQVWYQPEHAPRRPWSHQMQHWPFGRDYATGADFVQRHNIEGLVYGYVFRRRLFTLHPELRFTPGIYHQDEELIFKIFTLAGPTVYLPTHTYIYYEHTGSSLNTRTEARKRKLMDDYLTILHGLIAWRDRTDPETQEPDERLQEVMHYKLSYLAMDMLRMLIRGQYPTDYIRQVIGQMRQMELYPLPQLHEIKYLAARILTHTPWLVCWWACHPSLSRRIGF